MNPIIGIGNTEVKQKNVALVFWELNSTWRKISEQTIQNHGTTLFLLANVVKEINRILEKKYWGRGLILSSIVGEPLSEAMLLKHTMKTEKELGKNSLDPQANKYKCQHGVLIGWSKWREKKAYVSEAQLTRDLGIHLEIYAGISLCGGMKAK